MRDYKRPDRLALREMMAQNGQARKRSRAVESTPVVEIVSIHETSVDRLELETRSLPLASANTIDLDFLDHDIHRRRQSLT